MISFIYSIRLSLIGFRNSSQMLKPWHMVLSLPFCVPYCSWPDSWSTLYGKRIRYSCYWFYVLIDDNLSTIISSTKSDGKIAKRWNILSFHRAREAVAHGIVKPFHTDGKDSYADVLSKHTSSRTWYELMRPLILWRVNEKPALHSRGEGSINVLSPLPAPRV